MLSIRKSCVFILSLSLLLFFSLCTISKASEAEPAKSTVSSTLAEGTWTVFGVASLKFTHKKHHLVDVIDTTETWTFAQGGSFTSLVGEVASVSGFWSEKGKNVTVSFNKAEYQTLLEEALAARGNPAIVAITKLTAKGTVSTSTIKGKLTVKANVYLFDYAVWATMTATANFVGSHALTEDIVNADPESKSLPEAISGLVVESINLPEE